VALRKTKEYKKRQKNPQSNILHLN